MDNAGPGVHGESIRPLIGGDGGRGGGDNGARLKRDAGDAVAKTLKSTIMWWKMIKAGILKTKHQK